MKMPLLIWISILLSVTAFSQTLSRTGFLEDLEYLKKTLPEKHTNLFAKITAEDFNRKVDQVSLRVNGFDRNRFIVELFKLAKSIGDEHTFIEADFNKILPVQFEFFQEGLFVTAIDPAYREVVNSRMESINGHPVDEVIGRFRPIIQDSNPSYFTDRLLQHLGNPALLNGLELIPNDSVAVLTLKTPGGKTKKVALKAVSGKNVAELDLFWSAKEMLSRQKMENDYFFNYDPETKTLYFNYRECRDQQQYPFNRFNSDLFAAIRDKKPEKLVLDLRQNSGGNSGILSPFIDSISTSYLNSRSRFYVLIGKHTFSSAVMNGVTLKRNTKATFIGQATSGNINHYGEVRGFKLPNSQIVVAYSTRYWETWPGMDGPLKPDLGVNYSIKKRIAGKDEALMLTGRKF